MLFSLQLEALETFAAEGSFSGELHTYRAPRAAIESGLRTREKACLKSPLATDLQKLPIREGSVTCMFTSLQQNLDCASTGQMSFSNLPFYDTPTAVKSSVVTHRPLYGSAPIPCVKPFPRRRMQCLLYDWETCSTQAMATTPSTKVIRWTGLSPVSSAAHLYSIVKLSNSFCDRFFSIHKQEVR